MKTKTANLLNLISTKKEEMRKAKRDRIFREHAKRNHHPLTREEEIEFNRMIREGQHLLEIDKRNDARLNKDVNKIHKQMFGY